MKKIIIPVLLTFLFISCDMLPAPDNNDKDKEEENKTTKFENILNSYSVALSDVLTEDQRTNLIKNSTTSAGDVTSQDPEVLVPLAVESIITSLKKDTSLTSAKRISVIDTVSKKSVAIIKGELNTASRSSRAINLAKLKTILNKVAKSIVKSVPASGIIKEEYSKANESSLTNLVSSLGDDDIPEDKITELSQTVTDGAVSQLSDTKTKEVYKDMEDKIVKSISQGAVKGIVKIDSDTIKKEELIQDVTKAALDAVKEIETDSKKVTDLIMGVTDGTTEGINQVKDQLGDEKVVEAIKGITKETIETIKTFDLTEEEQKAKVSELSKKISEKVKANLPDIDNEKALKAVVSGIASGAQEVSNGFTAETLKETIKITDKDNKELDLSDLDEEIDQAIKEGQEEKKEEADLEEKEILEALAPIGEAVEEIRKALNLGVDANEEQLNKVNSILTQLKTVTGKYPENKLLGEAYYRIAELSRLLYQVNSKESDINKAKEAAIKASTKYDNTSWYAYEAALLLRRVYTYDTREFDKSLEVAKSIATNYGEKPEHIFRSKHDIMDTYWQQLYHEFEWQNRFDDSTDFINDTYIPAIEDVLTAGISYSSDQAWIIRAAHERIVETFTWLHNLEGAIQYCYDLIEELETADIPEADANVTQANLYSIVGKLLREETADWPENRLVLIDNAIDALEEGLKLSVNNGEITDRWVYVHNLENLMSSFAQKSNWYWEAGELRDSIFFNMERRMNELTAIARDLGDDNQGQYANILSYTHEGRFYLNMGNAYRDSGDYNSDNERAKLYYQKAETALTKGIEIRNDFYLVEGSWVIEQQALDLVPVYLNLYGYDKAITFYNEISPERVKADWSIGGMLSEIGEFALQQIDKPDVTKEDLELWYDEMAKILPTVKEVFDREPREWYSRDIRNRFTSFYFIYFMKIRDLTPKPEAYDNEKLINARHTAIHFGKPETWFHTSLYGNSNNWYHLLFDNEANNYGDTVVLDGGVDVIIK